MEYTVTVKNGTTQWYLNGKLHREDGPAVEYANGTKRWYLNGNLHREDEHAAATNPAKELTIAEIEKLLGYSIKVVK